MNKNCLEILIIETKNNIKELKAAQKQYQPLNDYYIGIIKGYERSIQILVIKLEKMEKMDKTK